MTDLTKLLSDPTSTAVILQSLSALAFVAAGLLLMISAVHAPLRRFCVRLLALGAFLAIAASIVPGLLR